MKWQREQIIAVRVSSADLAALEEAAGAEPVPAWLRRLGLEEAKRRTAARSVSDLLDEARSKGFGLPEAKAAKFAERATDAVRAGPGDLWSGRRGHLVGS